MEESGSLLIPRILAMVGVVPFALLFLMFGLKLGITSLRVRTGWTRIEAHVGEVGTNGALELEIPGTGRLEIEKGHGFDGLSLGETVPIFQNPAQSSEIRRMRFQDLWLNPLLMILFAALLSGIAGFMFHADSGSEFQKARTDFEVAVAAANAGPAKVVPPLEDVGPILLKEPSQSWKANVFWGLLFGLTLCAFGLFAPREAPALKRFAFVAGGVVWMTFFGCMAVRNRGRSVQLEGNQILVTDPFSRRTIPLSSVHSLVRSDVRKEQEAWDAIGRSRYKNAPLNTMPNIVVYELKDARGWTLLRLDKDMEPRVAMTRFLRRIEQITGPAKS